MDAYKVTSSFDNNMGFNSTSKDCFEFKKPLDYDHMSKYLIFFLKYYILVLNDDVRTIIEIYKTTKYLKSKIQGKHFPLKLKILSMEG